MKYKLFTAADPSDSKTIGVADTVNVLPEFNKQGQLCWRSRPGLKNSEYNFSLNSAPVAQNDAYATDENHPLMVSASGVLGNDSDPEGDALTAVLVTGPTHGALTLNPNGSFTYTPAANYHGPDSFTYKANDGSLDSNAATVTLTVNPGPPDGGCLYDGTVFNSVPGWSTWDVIDNVTGTYSCSPGPKLETRIMAHLTPGTRKTIYFIYNFKCFKSTACNDSIALWVLNGAVELTGTSTLCYGNVDSDVTSISFLAGYPAKDCEPLAWPQGEVTIECVKIIDRDWVAAGELEGQLYYP